MKLKVALLILILSNQFYAQELKENQIRVVGQYRETLQANKFELVFNFQDVVSMSNGEKQVIKNYEEAKEETQNYLKASKIGDFNFKLVNINGQQYGNKGASYSLILDNIDKVNQIIQDTKIIGLNNITVKYLFDKSEKYLNSMASKALDNAKEKANFIANKANKKIGKLLIIDDRTNMPSINLLSDKNDKNIEQEVGYSLFVTYELLD